MFKLIPYYTISLLVSVCAFMLGGVLHVSLDMIEKQAYERGQGEILIDLPIQALQHIEVHDVSDIARDI